MEEKKGEYLGNEKTKEKTYEGVNTWREKERMGRDGRTDTHRQKQTDEKRKKKMQKLWKNWMKKKKKNKDARAEH